MKALTQTSVMIVFVFLAITALGQRKITGIVYKDGKPAAGIAVEAARTDGYYTSFDGKYELMLHPKTKTIRFIWGDEVKKLNLTGTEGDVINFSFDGLPIPEGSDEPGVILKDFEQLQKDRDADFSINYSLYREYFKQEDFKSGREPWTKVYKMYPKSTRQIYDDGIKMYDYLIEKAIDPNLKASYLDTIMMIYDKRIKYLNNSGDVLDRKSVKYFDVLRNIQLNDTEILKRMKVGFELTNDAVKVSGDQTQPAVLVLQMQAAKQLFAGNQMNKGQVLEVYESIMGILDKQALSADTKEKADQAIPLIHSIIEGSGALDCTSMVELYGPKFKENPNNIDLLKKMIYMFRREDCTDDELFISASEKLYELQPSSESALNMARLFLKRKEFDKALSYYKEAYENESNNDLKATYYYEAAMLSLQQEKNMQARDLAREAIKLKPDYCEALMLMGDIYVQSSRGFGADDFERSTVFWVAVDYFDRATKLANCKADAETKAKSYSGYYPNKEEVFFRGFSEGQRYTVGGWINESTTIRVK